MDNNKGFMLVEVVLVGLILGLLFFCYLGVTTGGRIKQGIIAEKTGKQVTLWEAINYPRQYFTDATVRVEK